MDDRDVLRDQKPAVRLTAAEQAMFRMFRDTMWDIRHAIGFKCNVMVQYPIHDVQPTFRADFAIPQLRLIIEVDEGDGTGHRTQQLNDAGWIVLRYCPAEVIKDPDKVRAHLIKYLTVYGRSLARLRARARR